MENHAASKRSIALMGLVLVSGLLLAQDPVVYRVKGGHRSDGLGSSLAVLNDIDGDGVNDFVAGATQDYLDPEVGPYGYVHLISGKTGQRIRTWRGSRTSAEFGYQLTALGDVDKDGKVDFVTAELPETVFIVSPVKDEWIKTFQVPRSSRLTQDVYANFDSADLNGDGVLDLVLGNDGHSLLFSADDLVLNVGRVMALSGDTWKPLWDVIGSTDQGMLGIAVAVIGDVDGDGLPDVVAGEPMGLHRDERDRPGKVRVFRGRDGKLLRTIEDDPGFYLGSNLANLGDLDRDGFPELAIASTGYRRVRGRDQGWVGIYSTRTFEVLQQFTGLEGELTLGFHGDALGYKLGPAGDVDLDGVPDYLIAAYRVGEGIGPDYGRLDLRSGRSGKLLASYQEKQEFDSWIGDLSPLGDIDGDGRPEFLVGSPNIPTDLNHNRETFEQGEVLVMRFEVDLPAFIRGDANGDGRVNIADAITIARKVYLKVDSGECLRAFDAQADGKIDSFDFIRILRYCFLGGYSPGPPFPECGRFGGLWTNPFDCRNSPCQP